MYMSIWMKSNVLRCCELAAPFPLDKTLFCGED